MNPTVPPDWSDRGTECYKISMWEINPTAGGTGPTVGPNVTKCQCPYVGKNSTALSHCSSAPAPRASPCHHSNLDISANSPKLRKPPLSAWSCRSWQQLSGQQSPRDFRLRPQYQHIALSSVPPCGIQHHQAPIPLAQASVRSPLTLQKERTRKLQVPMRLAASTAAHLSSGSR